ncbi:uncharacterized protein N7511_007927 [Penicillium nucicola]|uniref:uncharacterized protein n=1 Tax=Penicillium nucicola TaxID=1850975 RepID=UPI00254524E6|nr:uncharacterized protein N7511_007927 [Penicillium nucicola]KAJ5753774.1 hypothetical protein N7511_007927 [Penicillium nucicola]
MPCLFSGNQLASGTIRLPPAVIIPCASECLDNHKRLPEGKFIFDYHIMRDHPRLQSGKDLRPKERKALICSNLKPHPRSSKWLPRGTFDYVKIK